MASLAFHQADLGGLYRIGTIHRYQDFNTFDICDSGPRISGDSGRGIVKSVEVPQQVQGLWELDMLYKQPSAFVVVCIVMRTQG